MPKASKFANTSLACTPPHHRDIQNKLVAPAADSIAAVTEWLMEHGAAEVTSMTPNGDFLGASMTAEQAARLVGGTYFDFKHTTTGRIISRLEAPSYSQSPWGPVDPTAAAAIAAAAVAGLRRCCSRSQRCCVAE